MRQTYRHYQWSDAETSMSVFLDCHSGPAPLAVWAAVVPDTQQRVTREGSASTWSDALEQAREAFLSIGGKLAVIDAVPSVMSAGWGDHTSGLVVHSKDTASEWTVTMTLDAMRFSVGGVAGGFEEAIEAGRKAFELFSGTAGEFEAELFTAWKERRVQHDPAVLAGAATFRGTRLPVMKIGSMLIEHGAKAIGEIKADYPYLTNEDLAFSKSFVDVQRSTAKSAT